MSDKKRFNIKVSVCNEHPWRLSTWQCVTRMIRVHVAISTNSTNSKIRLYREKENSVALFSMQLFTHLFHLPSVAISGPRTDGSNCSQPNLGGFGYGHWWNLQPKCIAAFVWRALSKCLQFSFAQTWNATLWRSFGKAFVALASNCRKIGGNPRLFAFGGCFQHLEWTSGTFSLIEKHACSFIHTNFC